MDAGRMTIEQIRDRSRRYAAGEFATKRKSARLPGMTDEDAYRAECLRKLSAPNPPAELVDSLVRHWMRCHGRGVRASRLLGRKAALALFGDILAA
jgi:hypothetical protein